MAGNRGAGAAPHDSSESPFPRVTGHRTRIRELEAEVERLRELANEMLNQVKTFRPRAAGDAMLYTPQISKRTVTRWKNALDRAEGGQDE